MKKVAIVGLGWLGMPLALSLTARGWQVTGSKTTQDGVEAARMCGIDSYPLRLEPQLVCDTEDLDALMNVDALVITPAGPAYRGRGRVLSTGGAGDRRYRAGVPYSADRLHQLHLGVWQRQRYGEGEFPASAANRQRTGAQGAGGLAAQPAGDVGGYSAPGRAGGAFPPSGRFSPASRRRMASTWSIWCICRMWWPLSNCCCRPRRAGTSILYVRPAIRRAASFIRRWPASSVCRRRCSATARTAARARLWMAIVSAMSWGLSTSTPIRW